MPLDPAAPAPSERLPRLVLVVVVAVTVLAIVAALRHRRLHAVQASGRVAAPASNPLTDRPGSHKFAQDNPMVAAVADRALRGLAARNHVSKHVEPGGPASMLSELALSERVKESNFV